MPNEHPLRHSLISVLWSFAFLSLILWQYDADRRFTLFFVNKAIAQTAVITIGISFFLGPLAKIFHFLSHHVRYRKYFGLVGFALVIAHIITSLLQFSDRFTLKWYQDHLLGITAAIIAAVIFLILTITSHNELIRKLGGHQWKTIQRMGYIALILTLIHIFTVGSGRWQQWLDGKVDMPTNFLVFIFGILVLTARLIALGVDHFKPQSSQTPLPPTPTT